MTFELIMNLVQAAAIVVLVVSLVIVSRSYNRMYHAAMAREARVTVQLAELEREIERLDHRQRERDEEIRRRIRADNEARRRVLGAVRGEETR